MWNVICKRSNVTLNTTSNLKPSQAFFDSQKTTFKCSRIVIMIHIFINIMIRKYCNLHKRDLLEKLYHLSAFETYCSDSASKSVKCIRIKGCNYSSIQRSVYQNLPVLNTLSSSKNSNLHQLPKCMPRILSKNLSSAFGI